MRRGAVARGTGWLWLAPIVLAAALLGTACACGVYTLAGRVRSLAWAP